MKATVSIELEDFDQLRDKIKEQEEVLEDVRRALRRLYQIDIGQLRMRYAHEVQVEARMEIVEQERRHGNF